VSHIIGSIDDSHHADTADRVGGGDNYAATYHGTFYWPVSTERHSIYEDLIGNSSVVVWSKGGFTPATYSMAVHCKTDSVVFIMDPADTAAAASDTINYFIASPGI
jgi:hypothetical protein